MGFPHALLAVYFLGLVLVTVAVAASIKNGSEPVLLERVKRVIGGEEIEQGEWPYLVRLRGKVPSTVVFGIPISYNNYYCGGSLISSQWVLTAAHCVKQQNYPDEVMTPSYWHAKVGEVQADLTVYDLGMKAEVMFCELLWSDKDNFYDGIVHWVGRMTNLESLQTWNVHASRIVIHPAYNEAQSWRHDLALFKLKEELPINSNSNIGTVSLPPATLGRSWPEDGAGCVMKGWGCSERGGTIENVARSAVLPKVSDSECQRVYAVSSSTRLCAGRRLSNMGICSGDSGGPLVCRYNNDRWTLAGVASFTSANNPESFPGVFTRVTEYVDWIEDVIIDDYFKEHYPDSE